MDKTLEKGFQALVYSPGLAIYLMVVGINPGARYNAELVLYFQSPSCAQLCTVIPAVWSKHFAANKCEVSN
jgi:hypothetical protein